VDLLITDAVCDLCRVRGADPLRPAVEQLRMAVRELHATVSLCAEHRTEVEQFAETVLLARRPRVREAAAFPRLRAGEDREQIRSWAQLHGLPVATSGTISAAVLQVFREAHGTARGMAEGAGARRTGDV
jgi:hypothetical protein